MIILDYTPTVKHFFDFFAIFLVFRASASIKFWAGALVLSSADHGHAAALICSCSFPTTTFFVTALMCRKPPRHHRARPQELFRYFQNRLAPSSLPQKCCCFPWAACCKSDGPIPQFMAGCHYDNFLQLILLETLRILTNRTANKKHSSFSIHLYHNCCAFGRGRRIRTLGTRFWRHCSTN